MTTLREGIVNETWRADQRTFGAGQPLAFSEKRGIYCIRSIYENNAMRLPNVGRAQISEAKVVRYLLSTTHRAGKSKASFFMQFEFDSSRWEELARALKQHATDNEIQLEEKTSFGTRYIIDGLLKAPDGKWLNIRSAWFIDEEGEAPRFVTAHPLKRRRL